MIVQAGPIVDRLARRLDRRVALGAMPRTRIGKRRTADATMMPIDDSDMTRVRRSNSHAPAVGRRARAIVFAWSETGGDGP